MRFTIITLTMLFSAGLGFSQEAKLAFRTLALAQAKFPQLWVVESGKPLPITFVSAQPSPPFSADRTNPLPIFKGPLGDKGKPSDTTPTLVPLPTSSSSSILLLGWIQGDKPAFLAIDDPFATMKKDDWLVINPSKSELGIQIGATAKPIPIKANSNQAIKNTAPPGTGAAVTIAAKQADGSWKAVYTSYWPIYDNMRGLVVVVQNGEKLNVNYITDQIATAAPAPKP
ncbi:MAG: hypothetical protein V4819_01190 [Verrucomicrobiota bacterium]